MNRGYAEKLSKSGGVAYPAAKTDPFEIETMTHTLSGTYSYAPDVVIVSKCDIGLWIVSITTTTVVIGVGTGSATTSTFNYDLMVYSNG